METTQPPPSPRLPARDDSLFYDAHDPSPSEATAPDVAEQDLDQRAAQSFGLSLFGARPSASPQSSPRSPVFPSTSHSPRSALVQQRPSTVPQLGATEGASGDSEEEDEADISTLMRQGATREQAVVWIKEDRERLSREASRGNLAYSPTSQLPSSPESYRHSESSPALHQLSSDDLFPLLPPLPTPSLDTHDPYAPTVVPQSYDHMKTLEALEKSDIWRQAAAPRDEGAFRIAEGAASTLASVDDTSALSIGANKTTKLTGWLIEELVQKRDADRVEEARRSGRALGEETRRIWRHLDRSQMETGPSVVNGYTLALATRFRDLQSPPPLSPPSPSRPLSTSADSFPSLHPSHSQSQADSFNPNDDAQADPRADTPLPRTPRPLKAYKSPDDESPFTDAVRERPFQTFGTKFLPTRGGAEDTTWTRETGKVLDLGGRPTLYRDRIGMANWGRTLLSPIISESELTATASARSRLSSPAHSYVSSTSTAKSPIRRRPIDPLSAAAIERARLPPVSPSIARRARGEGAASTSLTARALESLAGGESEAGSSSAAVEEWRENERRRRRKAEKNHQRAMEITGGLDTLTYAKKMMLEDFGIDLMEEEGPTPPYQEHEGGSSVGRTSSSRLGDGSLSHKTGSSRYNPNIVPKGLVHLFRQYVRMREDEVKAASSKPNRLPDEYGRSDGFPSHPTTVYSTHIDAPPLSNLTEAITSIDPSTTPPSSPPKATAEPSPRSHRAAAEDGQRRKVSSSTAKSISSPDIFSDEAPEDSETFTLAPLAPSPEQPSPPRREDGLHDTPRASSVPPHSRQPSNSPSDFSPEEKARRKALRKAGIEPDPAPARHARRDNVFTSLLELNKEKSRLHSLLPRDSIDFSMAHVSTLNNLAQLIIDAKELKSPEMYDEAAKYYQQSLQLDPEQPELAFFIGKWNAYKADNDKQYSAHYQQRALECFLSATQLDPMNPRYYMELARAYVNQEIPLESDEPKELLAIRALRASVDYSAPRSDTRIVAYYRMHFTWRMLARSAADGDPDKLELYRQALSAIEACGSEYHLRELLPEAQRPPSTGEVLPPPALIRKSEQTIRQEAEEYLRIEEEMMAGSPRADAQPPTLRRATEPALSSARIDDLLDDDHTPRPFSPAHQAGGHRSPKPRRQRDEATVPPFSPTQQDGDNGAPPRSKTAPPPSKPPQDSPSTPTQREAQYPSVAEGQESPRRRQPASNDAPRTRNVGIQVGRTRSLREANSLAEQPRSHSRSVVEPFDHATDLIDDGILKLQSILALSQQRQTKRIAAEATEVHQSLAKLQDDLIFSINERNIQAAALTKSLQEVLKELEGLPQRIHASAKLAQLRHESAHPVPPSTNPISFTLAKLRKAKEASKALRKK